MRPPHLPEAGLRADESRNKKEPGFENLPQSSFFKVGKYQPESALQDKGIRDILNKNGNHT
jgi:hypothetical protein